MKQLAILFLAMVVLLGCQRQRVVVQQGARAVPPSKGQDQPAESLPMADNWPFADDENTLAFTQTRVVDESRPILYVVHDEEGDWQFLDGGEVSEEDAALVSLKTIVGRDPSVKVLADLPLGWAAERSEVGGAWRRFPR
jgi:hypothetical protein